MDKNQDAKFTNFLREKAKEAELTMHYRPTYFLGMLESEGGYRTALRLLSAKNVSEGFIKLWENRRVDLSVEALVVESEWRQAFDPALLARAEKKLKDVKYPFIRWGATTGPTESKTSATGNPAGLKRKSQKNRIVIAWPCGDEYIDIDLDSLGIDTEISFTKQTYEEGTKLDIYEVSSTVQKLKDGRYEISITYESDKNPEITESWWGTTRIIMRRDDLTGVALWHDEHDTNNNGDSKFKTVYAPDAEDNLPWTADELAITQRIDLDETVKKALRNERRGQRVFRARVLQREPVCRLTGVNDPTHLRASHIKPWAECNPRERLDGSNGLMLAPHIDHLFDRAYISFEDDGNLLVLNDDIEKLLHRWGIDQKNNPPLSHIFDPRQCEYLVHHRQRFASLRQLVSAK